MKNPNLPLFFLMPLTLLFAIPAHADWQGTMHIQSGGSADQPQGKVFAKGAKIRFEMQAQGHQMIILADEKAHKASMLMPAQKVVLNMSQGAMDKQMMGCSTEDVDGCFKAKGYKVTGHETVDGHPCSIYEGDEAHGAVKSHEKVWRPTDMKEVFMIKEVSHTSDGQPITTVIKDIKMGKLTDSLFQVPSDYKAMQMPNFGKMQH